MEKILLVDDEQFVLDGLKRQLRRKYAIHTADGGEKGLQLIQSDGPFAVVVSDMRMPEMNGIEFLTQVRRVAPDSIRIMLTGYADQKTAINAINEGAIFRFLTKPCSLENLTVALDAALDQYRLITAEKELLEKTLKGSIKVLVDILSLSAPAAFSQATRLRKYAAQIVARLEFPDSWQYEIAALLSSIGFVNIPPETITKHLIGEKLTGREQEMIDAVPETAGMLLANIPRLSAVALMITRQNTPCSEPMAFKNGDFHEAVRIGANLLKVLTDFDILLIRNYEPEEAIRIMSEQIGLYDRTLLNMLAILDLPRRDQGVRNIRIDDLREGMIIDADIRNTHGILVVPKGYEVNESTCQRLKNFLIRQTGAETVRVLMPVYAEEESQ